jgi:predicted AAA+ superfamily ATPase
MERKINIKLEEWLKNRRRLPLIVQGARQVGKTYSVLSFGRERFDSVLYFNFESNRELHRIFERDLSPRRILRELSVLAGENIREERSLIFFDEIQACSKALTSLKYFAEETPGYMIIAAGSLLGVAVNRDESSYPVGKVATVTMYPLDFEEFLWAVGQKEAAGIIHDSFSTFSSCSLHETFIDYYRTYLFTGGMPQVVKEYMETHDPMIAGEVKRGINNAYIADMARYAGKAETVRIISVYNSLTAQLAKENHKFQYKVIKSGARIAEYGSSIDWLKASGIVLACQKVSEGNIPLSAYSDPAAFKLYHSDTGLLCAMAGLTEKSITAERLTGSGFIGALAENYVAKSLKAAGYALYYWESKGKAEVDFIIQKGEQVIPVEVKASDNVRSRSLGEFVRRYSPPFSYRVSEKNFGNENNIRSIPLYALFCV